MPQAAVPARVDPAVASLATLALVESQANGKRKVQVQLNSSVLKIGKSNLEMTVTSSHNGYVYLVLLSSDAKSFYILFPNGLDSHNSIKAGQAMKLPRESWEVMAAGPAGVDQILVIVSDSPRKLDSLVLQAPTANEPFTYALNDLVGRSALVDFLTTSSIPGASESFGVKRVTVREIP